MQKRECRKLNVRCSGSGGRWPSAHIHKFKIQSNGPLKLAKARERETDRQRPRQTQRVLWFLCPINCTVRETDSPTDRLTVTEKWASSALMEVDQLHTDPTWKPTSIEADHYTHRHKLKTNKYRADHYAHRHKLKSNKYRADHYAHRHKLKTNKYRADHYAHRHKLKTNKYRADHYAHRPKLKTNKYWGGPLWPSSRCTQAIATWTTQNLVPQNSAPACWQHDQKTSTAGRPTKQKPKESVLAGGKEAFQQPGGLGSYDMATFLQRTGVWTEHSNRERNRHRERRGGEGGRERERETETERTWTWKL